MHLQEAQDAPARVAPGTGTDGARGAVGEELFHLLARRGVALRIVADTAVDERVEEQLQGPGARALRRRVDALRGATLRRPVVFPDLGGLQAVHVLDEALTARAEVKVGALRAVPPLAGGDVSLALVAGVQVRRDVWVVEVEQEHHRRVLRPPELVELVPVPLAYPEQREPRVDDRRINDRVRLRCLLRTLGELHAHHLVLAVAQDPPRGVVRRGEDRRYCRRGGGRRRR